jgi:hypothetical protein
MTGSTRLVGSALLLAGWLGAALLTVAVVAPGAFAVLPTRTVAGAMVGRVLPTVFVAGMVAGLAVALLMGVRGTSVGAATTALLSAAACGVAHFGINPRIQRLREEIGGAVDALSSDDPRRVAFGLLHGYSVAGLGVAMLAAVLSLTFVVLAMRSRP